MKFQRWTEKRGREVVKAWRRSGLSMSAFAKQQGITTQRLAYWRERVPAEDVDEPKQGAAFVPAVVVGRAAFPSRGGGVIVHLPQGVVVEGESTDQVDPKWLARLLRELEMIS